MVEKLLQKQDKGIEIGYFNTKNRVLWAFLLCTNRYSSDIDYNIRAGAVS